MSKTYQAHGKLLLTGEYFVLDGAVAFALPTQLGQTMIVKPIKYPGLYWRSKFHNKNIWFSGVFKRDSLQYEHVTDSKIAQRLQDIFKEIHRQQPDFFSTLGDSIIDTQLEFPHDWGLGSSSTLLALLAQWSNTNPYLLLKNTFGGSGYDIACAVANGPIFYKKNKEQVNVTPVDFKPTFQEQLYFVYLGQKQNSRLGIQRYREKVKTETRLVDDISAISQAITEVSTLNDFEKLLVEHEEIVARTLELPRAKNLYFSDYWGEVKSLGAWGGDFVLATSDRGDVFTKKYFNEKGFEVGLLCGGIATILFTSFMAVYMYQIDTEFAAHIMEKWNLEYDLGTLMLVLSIFIMGLSTTLVLTLTFMQLLKKSWNTPDGNRNTL